MQTLNNTAARNIAARMNGLVKARDLKAHAERVTHLVQNYSVTDQALVIKYIGLDWKLRERAERRSDDAHELYDAAFRAKTKAEFGIEYLACNRAHNEHGDKRVTRFFVRGPYQAIKAHARATYPASAIYSDYSPTGLWFGPAAKVKIVRKNICQIIITRNLDC